MFKDHDFHYALENTRVVVSPKHAIETFGTTSFRFLLVSELMDEVNVVRVRDGRIEAERPRIVSPQHFSRLLLDGFGENAREYADWLESSADAPKILRYGFQFRKTDLSENLVRQPMEAALDRLESELARDDDPMSALIAGVDEAWEVCLMKFTMDLIARSAVENMQEWKRRGFI
jgi:hypothetical protein